MSDPYAIRPGEVQVAPLGIRARMRHLGPSVIVTGSIVGSGEIILTSSLGAAAGFALLWWVLLSCWSKSIVQAELGRYVIASGDTYLRAINRLPGKLPGPRGPVAWPIWLGLIGFFPGITGMGGILGGAGQALALLVPSLGGLGATALVALVATVLLAYGTYRRFEGIMLLMVASFTVCTLVCAIAMQWTEFRLTIDDLSHGLRFELPPEVLILALSVYGYTGVNSGEISAYTYWCVEKGYPSFAGQDRADPEWPARARGWIHVMQTDVWLTLLMLTCATLPFYVLGAGVLHRLGERPSGTGTIESLSNMFTATLGEWAFWIFAVGAFFILFSTVLSGIGAGGRGFADYVVNLGFLTRDNLSGRLRFIRGYLLALPALGFLIYLGFQNPVALVTVGALMAALMAPVQSGATLWLQRRHMDPRVRPGRLALGTLIVVFVFQLLMSALVVRYVVF